MRPPVWRGFLCMALAPFATAEANEARLDIRNGTYAATEVAIVAAGRTCEIGAPMTPAYVLVVGPVVEASAPGALALLRDDAGLVMPLFAPREGASAAYTLADPAKRSDPAGKLGTTSVVDGGSHVVLALDYRRPVPDCRVSGRVTLRRVDDVKAGDDVLKIAAALALTGRADMLGEAGKWREALDLVRSAEAALADVLGAGHPVALGATVKGAELHRQLDELGLARQRNETAIKGLTVALGADAFQALDARQNLALVLWFQEDFESAERELRHVLQRYTSILDADDINRVSTMANLGSLLAQQGRLVEAERVMFDVLARMERSVGPEDPRSLVTLNNLAVMLDNGGRLDEALAMYATLVARYERTLGRKHPNALYALLNQADALGKLGRYEEAIPIAREVLAGSREVLGLRHTDTLLAQNNLAFLLSESGKFDEALTLQQEVVAIREATDGARSREGLMASNVLARIEMRRDPAAGLARLESAYASAKASLGDRDPITLQIGARLAAAQREGGRLDDARTTLRELVDRLEAWRESGAMTAETRRALFAQWAPSYKSLAAVHLAVGDVSAAFEQAERSKARVLVETLALQRGEARDVLPADAVATLARLDRSLAESEASIAAAPADPSARLPLELSRVAIADEARELRRALRARYPKYAALSEARIVGVAEGARELPRGASFVSYLRDGDRLLAFVVDRQGRVVGRDLGAFPGLDDTVIAYRTLLIAPRGRPVPAVWRLADGRYRVAISGEPGAVRIYDSAAIGRELAKRLVDPLPELMRTRRWIISPDGALALLPFETLPRSGRPLVATRDISYTPSLTVHAYTTRRGRDYDRLSTRASLYAMGAARYQGATPAAATPPNVQLASLARALAADPEGVRRAYDTIGASWPELPQSAAEVRQVAARFPGSGNVTIRTLDEATEAQLLADDRRGVLANHRYVLLSAHGFLSTEAPSLSAVVLGQRDVTPEADGYVTAAEWTGYTLRSDLIVISACETGVGKVIEGEGVAGLPYALFVAGNRNALLTLWPVADRSTALFVSRFFGHLRGGLSQSAALTRTKREFASKGAYTAPVHWAPFVLWGA